MARDAAERCVICYEAERVVRETVMESIYRWQTDEAARHELAQRGGLCTQHGLVFLAFASPLGMAEIFGPLARLRAQSVRSASSRPQDLWNPDCPLCEARAKRENALLGYYARKADETAQANEAWDIPLCMPHVRLLVSRAATAQAQRMVLEATVRRLEQLADLAQAYAAKYRELRRSELTLAERRAPIAVVEALCGHQEDVRLG